MKNIKKISFYDFDSTLVESPQPEWGKKMWERKKGKEYPHIGWWGRSESLDLDVFDIQPIKSVTNLAKRDINNPETYVVVLTSRVLKLENEVRAVLECLNIHPDKYDLKRNNKTKGERVMEYIREFPNLTQIDVYDDNYEREITSYLSIVDLIPENIKFNIYHVDGNNINLIGDGRINKIIREEVRKIS